MVYHIQFGEEWPHSHNKNFQPQQLTGRRQNTSFNAFGRAGGVLTWEGTQCVKNKNALIVSPRQLKIDEQQMSSFIEFWMRWEWWWCKVWIVPHLFPFGSSTLKCETWNKLEAKTGTFNKKIRHMRKEQFKWRRFVLFAPRSRGSFIYIKIAMVKAPSRTILFLSGIFCRIQNVLRLVLGTASHQVGVFD